MLNEPGGVDVRCAATLRFPGDVLGHFDCGFDLPLRTEVEVVGSDGSLRLAPAFMVDDGELHLTDRARRTERIDVAPTSRFQLEVGTSRARSGEEPRLLDRRESVGQARTLLGAALRRSRSARAPDRLKRRHAPS